MRQKIVVGNWKMNNTLEETKILLDGLKDNLSETDVSVMVAPAFVNLLSAITQLKSSKIEVIAQNMHFAESGAYTGEISASMLKSIGIQTVILGHSERRAYFRETDDILAKKVQTALNHELNIIFCFGEELQDRKNNTHFDLVASQLKNALFDLDSDAWKKHIILAYEPVWAIGTGETATPKQAQEMHTYIRKIIANQYDNNLAESISILYGGSVKPQNAEEIFSQKDVDGGLIGGASLKSIDFKNIVVAT